MLDNLTLSVLGMCIFPLVLAFLAGFACGVWLAGGSDQRKRAWQQHSDHEHVTDLRVPGDDSRSEMDVRELARLHALRMTWQQRSAQQH